MIDGILYESSPLGRCPALVEGLPGNGFANGDVKGLSHVLVHLVNKPQGGDGKLHLHPVAKVGNAVELNGILATEVDGDDVAMGLHALGDEGFLPWKIADDTVLLPAAQAGREHQHVMVGVESCLYHGGEIAALASGLVDGDADGSQSGQVHQQVVDKITEVAIIVAADDGTQCNTVNAAQRVVAHKGVELAVILGWQVLLAVYSQCHLQILDTGFQPFRSFQVP